VSLLRAEKGVADPKRRRKIIVATHNANIPVNGDAELVLSLADEGGRCVVRTRASIDDAAVRKEIRTVLEGGAEAFRQGGRRRGLSRLRLRTRCSVANLPCVQTASEAELQIDPVEQQVHGRALDHQTKPGIKAQGHHCAHHGQGKQARSLAANHAQIARHVWTGLVFHGELLRLALDDIQRAVADGATVPIYYEGRLAKLAIDEDARSLIDDEFEEATEGEEIQRKEKLKSRWAQLESVVGADQRVKLLAKDFIDHFEMRQAAMVGKAMIVCMERANCVRLYAALTALPNCPEVKIVMTGNLGEDPPEWSQAGHLTTKAQRDAIKKRMVDPDDPLAMVIVCDMWLTGTDIPCLHTLYIDKPMRDHGLLQAIARVNRVFRDKPGGLDLLDNDHWGLRCGVRWRAPGRGALARQGAGVLIPVGSAPLGSKGPAARALAPLQRP